MTKGEKIHRLNVSMALAILMDTCEKQGVGSNSLKMEEQNLGVRITHHGMHKLIVRSKEVIADRSLANLVVRCVSGLATCEEYGKIAQEIHRGDNIVIDCSESRFFEQLAAGLSRKKER